MVAATPIKKGEQLLGTKLLKPGPNTGLSLQVSPNKRAVALAVDEIRGVSKLIRPGDRVDVITSIEYGKGQTQRREIKTLLQDVVVLATGQHITNNIPRALQNDPGGKPSFVNLNADISFSTITLEVTPAEAQNLIYIMSDSPGSIYLTLRNPNDRARTQMGTSSVESVLGRADLANLEGMRVPASVPTPAPAPVKVKPVKKRQGPFEDIR
jgi:pilus assembly protein CpaB